MRSIIIDICADSCQNPLSMELLSFLLVFSDRTLDAGGEVRVVSVKVIGATLDIRDESKGNAVCGMFAVDPLLLLLLVTSD